LNNETRNDEPGEGIEKWEAPSCPNDTSKGDEARQRVRAVMPRIRLDELAVLGFPDLHRASE
jgi:hypothetical protein